MTKLKTITTAAALALGLFSCKKQSCDNASACMINTTSDTVTYAWNSNFHDKILLPGDSACNYAGEMDWNESFTTFFSSSAGEYALDINDCENVYYID